MRPVSLRAARRIGAVHRRPRGRRTPPPLLAVATLALLLAASPWLDRAADGVSAALQRTLGLVVEEVGIDGAMRISTDIIRDGLATAERAPILDVDLEAARGRIEELPWVARAEVRRTLPNRIDVAVVEHRPLAVWLGPDGAALVSETGATLPVSLPRLARTLPLVTGAGAPDEAHALSALIGAAELLGRRVERVERMAGQRWRVVVEPSLRLELPAEAPLAALDRLARLDRAHGLLDRAVATIDLRLPDRIVVTPLPILRREVTG